MNRAVFLDRDGTINEDIGYLHRISDFRYIDGAVDGLIGLQALGFMLVLVTNQSGIGRGMFTEEEYHELDDWLLSDLSSKGVKISGSYYCPHHPEAAVETYRKRCKCRKPECGLFYRAADELDINLDHSIAIGDRMRDLCICGETKATGILFDPTGCSEERKELSNAESGNRIRICESWSQIVDMVKNGT